MYITVAQDALDKAAYHKKFEAIVGDENWYKFILVCSCILNIVAICDVVYTMIVQKREETDNRVAGNWG